MHWLAHNSVDMHMSTCIPISRRRFSPLGNLGLGVKVPSYFATASDLAAEYVMRMGLS